MESWTYSCLTNFFAMIFVLGLANKHVLERNELKWCDVPSFVNKTASTIQGAKITFQPNLYVTFLLNIMQSTFSAWVVTLNTRENSCRRFC